MVSAVPVVPAGTGPLTATKGTATGSLAVATFTDPGNLNPASYAATINWGDGTTSTGAIVLGSDGKTFTVQGGHTYAEQGSYTVQVSIAHGGLPPATVTDAATVVAPAAWWGAGGLSLSATKAVDTGSISVAIFTDPTDPDALSTLRGDDQLGRRYDECRRDHPWQRRQNFYRAGRSHLCGHAGAMTVTVTPVAPGIAEYRRDRCRDRRQLGGAVAQGVGIAATRNSPTGTVTVATFTDPGGPDAIANYSATINWGDGTTSTGTAVSIVLRSDGRTFSVLGGHTYSAAGSYQITVTVQHGAAPPAPTSVTASATVTNPAVTLAFAPFSGTAGIALANPVVATFTDPSGADAVANYSATINWGDGTTTAGTIVLGTDGKTFSVTGAHTYAAVGTPTVTVAVVHGTGAQASPSTSVSGTATVAYQAVSPTFVPFSGVAAVALSNQEVATFTDPNGAGIPANYSATIDWGDGTSGNPDITTGTITGPVGGVFQVVGSHTHAAAGTDTVKVSIVRGSAPVASAAASASGSATISSGHVTATGGLTISFAGALASSPVVATFTDPNGAGATGLYSATINWGDGVSSTGSIGAPVNGVFSVTGTHTYFDLGNVPITVSIARAGARSRVGDEYGERRHIDFRPRPQSERGHRAERGGDRLDQRGARGRFDLEFRVDPRRAARASRRAVFASSAGTPCPEFPSSHRRRLLMPRQSPTRWPTYRRCRRTPAARRLTRTLLEVRPPPLTRGCNRRSASAALRQ